MSDDSNEIAKRLGTAFAIATMRFLPGVHEALAKAGDGGDTSFGATVFLKNVDGVVQGSMRLHEPKLPTEPMKTVPFVLHTNRETGELQWLYEGTLDELRKEAARVPEPAIPSDYEPSQNRLVRQEGDDSSDG